MRQQQASLALSAKEMVFRSGADAPRESIPPIEMALARFSSNPDTVATPAPGREIAPIPPPGSTVRSDLASMLMPFFPEEGGSQGYATRIGSIDISIHSDGADTAMATPADRRILNVLAGHVADRIRQGHPLDRRIDIEMRRLIEALHGDVLGGVDYSRLIDRLNRLMATYIETSTRSENGRTAVRRFRWIDAVEHVSAGGPGSSRMVALRIVLSEEALRWMCRSLGFDVPLEDFRSITARRSSIWRIYEICLASLARSGSQDAGGDSGARRSEHGDGAMARIAIGDLRDRVPISSEIKVFKSRTLRMAMTAIAECPIMSGHVRLSLERERDGVFEPIEISQRAPHDRLWVRIDQGGSALPCLTVLASRDAYAVSLQNQDAAHNLASSRTDPGRDALQTIGADAPRRDKPKDTPSVGSHEAVTPQSPVRSRPDVGAWSVGPKKGSIIMTG